MAAGRDHAVVSEGIATAVTVGGGALAFYAHPLAAGLVLGAWIAVVCTPDLDHHAVTHCERRIERWNRAAGILWRVYWYPYMRLVGHRSKQSHSWPRGTVGRLFYLCWAPIVASVLYLALLEPELLAMWWLAVFVGWSLVDWGHLWLDGLNLAGERRRWFIKKSGGKNGTRQIEVHRRSVSDYL